MARGQPRGVGEVPSDRDAGKGTEGAFPPLGDDANRVSDRSPGGVVAALREQIARIEGGGRRGSGLGRVSSGWDPLDRLLPEGGFRWGTLVEWLAAGPGAGAETLAWGGACRASQRFCAAVGTGGRDTPPGAVVVLDSAGEFYPPGTVRLGMDPGRMIVVGASNPRDEIWALDQVLRCPGVAAVVAWPQRLDGHTFRRLQLAAEEGGGLGLLIRPEGVRGEPSWAEVRLGVEPLPAVRRGGRRLKVQLIRGRGVTGGGSVEVEIDDETGAVRLAPQLAHPAAPGRAARA